MDEWPAVWRRGLVVSVEVEDLPASEDGFLQRTICRIAFSDRLRRLELIGRHVDVAAFRNKA
ncbi:hypothetical protein [Parvibaculum sedimenti]|uniref:hypothetical protein n=1 Tax=Parvibaculum sedimenti TaxID=2608632 RepID=UPI001FEC2E92|nr:hypothetical protein [Parvibaculum sedimenti]